jgi:sulfonate transport system substrate-binding protein
MNAPRNSRAVTRRTVLSGLGGAAVLGLLPGRGAFANVPPPDPIRIAGLASADGGSVSLSSYCYVLDKQGWLLSQLARQHLGLQWFATAHEATGPMINEAFANGTIQFGIYGDLPSAILNAGGVETRLLVPNGVGGQDSYLVVPRNSTARSLEDLKGRTLAIHRGRPWELPLLRLLDSKGLSYKDFKVYNMNPNAGMAAIAANRVDALFTTLDAYILEAKGVGKIIWSTKSAPLDWRPRTELFALKSFVDRFPDLTQTVVTAYVKAAQWASQPQSRDVMIKVASKAERPEAVIRRSYDDDTFSWKDKWSPLFNDFVYDHYRHTVAIALDKKIIAKPIDVDKWLDPRFVNTALRDLNLSNYWQPVTAHGAPRAA